MEKNNDNEHLYNAVTLLDDFEELISGIIAKDQDRINSVHDRVVDGICKDENILNKFLQVFGKEHKKVQNLPLELAVEYTVFGGDETIKYIKDLLKKDPQAPLYLSLGDIYYYGMGVEKNLDLACKYYQIAISRNEPLEGLAHAVAEEFRVRAETYMDNLDDDPKNLDKAIKFFEKALECGDIKAGITLGNLYTDGKKIPSDDEKAIDYYEKTAKQAVLDQEYQPNFNKLVAGNVFNNLGCMYFEQTVAEDMPIEEKEAYYAKALECFLKSASLDFKKGFYHVGYMYAYGKGVEKDLEEARKWLESASVLGVRNATDLLEEINNINRK